MFAGNVNHQDDDDDVKEDDLAEIADLSPTRKQHQLLQEELEKERLQNFNHAASIAANDTVRCPTKTGDCSTAGRRQGGSRSDGCRAGRTTKPGAGRTGQES